MIEFNGYLSGAAEKHFYKKSAVLGQNILLISLLLFLPMVVRIGIMAQNWWLIVAYCFLFVAVPLLARIPKSKKDKLALTPKRIFTDDEYIVCIAETYTETRLIQDARFVRDYGQFYEIVFPFGKVSDKFICQKDLLSKGTLSEFEALFDGKVLKQ